MDFEDAAYIVHGGPGWEQQQALEEREQQETLEELTARIGHHLDGIRVAVRELEKFRGFFAPGESTESTRAMTESHQKGRARHELPL